MRTSTHQTIANPNEPVHTYRVSLGVESLWELARVAVTTGSGSVYERFPRSAGSIPLDFPVRLTDNSCNILAAPLMRTATSPRNDVHQGRVLFLRLSKQEGP